MRCRLLLPMISVGLSRGSTYSPFLCKSGWTDRDPVCCERSYMGPRHIVLDGVPGPLQRVEGELGENFANCVSATYLKNGWSWWLQRVQCLWCIRIHRIHNMHHTASCFKDDPVARRVCLSVARLHGAKMVEGIEVSFTGGNSERPKAHKGSMRPSPNYCGLLFTVVFSYCAYSC